MEEIWKDIPEYNGYKASNLGRIKGPKRILKGDVGDYGKTRYTLHVGKNRIRLMCHTLVAKTFPEICGQWFEGCEVHHKDGHPSNNRADNLICLSHEEHKIIHNEKGRNKGEKNPWFGRRHTEEEKRNDARAHRKPVMQLSLDGEELCFWFSCTDCERETGMHKAGINRCCLGKQHTAHGYKWCYASSPSSWFSL